tara:strand:- start:1683 stop:2489 length:807 start_codon:yes stop_codon:yes gene_type:complete
MKEDFDENIEDYIAYEDKYDIEFEKLEKKVITSDIENSLKDIYIEDKTPNGKIVMYYNFDNNIFNYYCNNKNAISYHELEAVAKLYTIKNDCRILFKEQPDQEQPDQEQPAQEQRNSVFAIVKNYNKIENKNRDERNKLENIKNKKRIEQFDKIQKVSNHFKYIGKLDDFYKENNIDSQDKTQSADQQQEDKQQEDKGQEDKEQADKQQELQEQEVKAYEENNDVVIVENDSTIVGKLHKDKLSSKILPNNNLTFAEFKKKVLEPNHI